MKFKILLLSLALSVAVPFSYANAKYAPSHFTVPVFSGTSGGISDITRYLIDIVPTFTYCSYVNPNQYMQVTFYSASPHYATMPQTQVIAYYAGQQVSTLDSKGETVQVNFSKKDIIPPNGIYRQENSYDYNRNIVYSQAAQNWDSQGQWLWYNGCQNAALNSKDKVRH